MEFNDLIQRALSVRKRYRDFEQQNYGASWTNEELALGFVGDVGDLAKLVMAQSGRRMIPDAERKLAHELADCLWSIIVLADAHGVDLEGAFVQTMDDLEDYLKQHSVIE
jgi:NTP pyrophosphatase (non-canonical NTP hydrolase)